jgi:DinB family protein
MVANPYAIHIGTRQPREVIETTALELHRLAGRIGAAHIRTPRAPGKWSARDILCHLADSEIVFAFRLRQALAEDHHVIQPFDQEKWAAAYDSRDADAALATFEAVRRWNLALLEAATPAQLSRPVTHPERGEMTVETIAETMAGHDLNHLKQLEAIASGPRSG